MASDEYEWNNTTVSANYEQKVNNVTDLSAGPGVVRGHMLQEVIDGMKKKLMWPVDGVTPFSLYKAYFKQNGCVAICDFQGLKNLNSQGSYKQGEYALWQLQRCVMYAVPYIKTIDGKNPKAEYHNVWRTDTHTYVAIMPNNNRYKSEFEKRFYEAVKSNRANNVDSFVLTFLAGAQAYKRLDAIANDYIARKLISGSNNKYFMQFAFVCGCNCKHEKRMDVWDNYVAANKYNLVFSIDIDGFRSYNTVHGYREANKLLEKVGNGIAKTIKQWNKKYASTKEEMCVVYHRHGDEYVVFVGTSLYDDALTKTPYKHLAKMASLGAMIIGEVGSGKQSASITVGIGRQLENDADLALSTVKPKGKQGYRGSVAVSFPGNGGSSSVIYVIESKYFGNLEQTLSVASNWDKLPQIRA